MTFEELYAEVSPIATQVLQIPRFDNTITMTSTPEWDSLNHIQLLSAIERKFAVEISQNEAFKLTSADKLVRYLHGILKGKQ